MKRPAAAGLALLPMIGLLAGCAIAPKTRASIEKTQPACLDTTVAIYFEANSFEVTREARAVLRSAAQMAQGCKVEGVRVIGLADATGAPGANQILSEQRAKATTEALASVGFTAPNFDAVAAGEAGAVTAGGQMQPLRRRADVRIDLSPPQ